MAYWIFFSLCMIWGTNFILMKKATLWFDPATVGMLRMLGGVVFLAAAQWWTRSTWSISRKDAWAISFVGLFGYAFPFLAQPVLITRCDSGFIAMMVSFVPLLTIVASIPMLGVYPTARQLLGVIGGLVCLLVIIKDGLDRDVTIGNFALAFSVPLMYTICNTFIKRRFADYAPLPLALSCLSIALVVTLPYGSYQPIADGAQTADRSLAIASVLILGVFGTGWGAYGFTRLLQDKGPLFAGMITYLIPTIALMWSWVDNERITVLQVVALAGVLSMVYVVQAGPERSGDAGPLGHSGPAS